MYNTFPKKVIQNHFIIILPSVKSKTVSKFSFIFKFFNYINVESLKYLKVISSAQEFFFFSEDNVDIKGAF